MKELGYISDEGDVYAVVNGLTVEAFIPEEGVWVACAKPSPVSRDAGPITEEDMLRRTGGVKPNIFTSIKK